jgi:hypothetical protein
MDQSPALSPAGSVSPDPVAESFLACLKAARRRTSPYDHWLLEGALPDGYCDEIAALPFQPPAVEAFNGRRETHNALRVYFNPENQARFEICRRVVDGFQNPEVRKTIEEVTGADLSDGKLRIEYCQDTDGFWLEPHTDISVKKFTMLVYLLDDPDLADAGTRIHEGPPDFKCVGAAPYGRNKGVIFVPGKNTWHSVARSPIRGVRKSIIINYVTSDWREKWELA